MIPAWQKGIVQRVEPMNERTNRYFIELPEQPAFDFRPGQFVTLDLPISEQRNKRWRSYSIASAPDGSNVLELVISLVPGGPGTEYIFRHAVPGAELSLRGPQGTFVLPASLDRDLFLVCTGTGVAPFRSMVQHILNSGAEHRAIHLIFGARYADDLLYRHEMLQLERQMPGFIYHPCLSRESWEGRSGYVHELYEELCCDAHPAYFMLCGWRNMVDEARERILTMGYDKKDIHLELYG